MNLLLLAREEIVGDEVELSDRRARHLSLVLRVAVGQRVRTGLVDGPLGTAEVLACARGHVRLKCTFDTDPPPLGADVLVLAVPRPPVLLRCLEDAAALGFARVLLTRSWRVEKSWLDARAMLPETMRAHLLLGLEQSLRTRVPELRTFARFKPFVEDQLDELASPVNRFVADPAAETSLARVNFDATTAVTLAIGPEGGFTEYEVESLRARGFAGVTLGSHPLRVGTALAAVMGQVMLRRAQGGH